jgi:hypothetical protein
MWVLRLFSILGNWCNQCGWRPRKPPKRSVSAQLRIVWRQKKFRCAILSGLWHGPQPDSWNCPDSAKTYEKAPKNRNKVYFFRYAGPNMLRLPRQNCPDAGTDLGERLKIVRIVTYTCPNFRPQNCPNLHRHQPQKSKFCPDLDTDLIAGFWGS